jgi:hypothetical protein
MISQSMTNHQACRRNMTSKPHRNGLILLLSLLLGCVVFYNISEVLALPHLHHILWPLNDSDDWLRMAQVRDWMGGASFYDHTVRHTNAPFGGVSIHWTRPMDILLAAVAVLLPAALTLSQKVMIAAAIIPPLLGVITFCALLAAARRAGAPRDSLYLLALIAVFSSSLQFHFLPGSADHHALQAALWSLALLYCTRRPRMTDALLAGLFLALSLWVSVEGLLLIGCIYTVFGLYAVLDATRIRLFAGLCFSTFFFSLISLLIEVPPSRFFSNVVYDSLSIVHVALLGFIALAVAPLIRLFPRLKTPAKRIVTAGAAVFFVSMAMRILFPDFFEEPMETVAGPNLTPYILSKVSEAQPLFKSNPVNILWTMPLPFIAAMTAFPFLKRKRIRRADGAIFFLFFAAFMLMTIQIRWFYYTLPVAIIVILGRLPVLMRFYAPRLPHLLQVLTPLHRAICVTFGVIFFCACLCRFSPLASLPRTKADACKSAINYLLQTGAIEEALKNTAGTLYIHPRSSGLAHYFTTADTIVAGYYHREVPALRDLQLIAKAPRFSAALPLLKKRHVRALLVCPDAYSPESWLNKLKNDPATFPKELRKIAPKQGIRRKDFPYFLMLAP